MITYNVKVLFEGWGWEQAMPRYNPVAFSVAESLTAIFRCVAELGEGNLDELLKVRIIDNFQTVIVEITAEDLFEIFREVGHVTCKFCNNPCKVRTAHLHLGKFVGDECCWDERLKATE